MKKFLFLFLIFFSGIIALAFIGDAVVSNNLRKSTQRIEVGWNDIFSGNLRCDVVINGNSRAWVQYNPIILDSVLHVNAYNLGIDGSCIDRQILKFNTYCRLNVKPKLVIQNIDFSTISLTSGFEREQFFPYFRDKTFLDELRTCDSISFMEAHFPFYRYLGYTDAIQMAMGFNSSKQYDANYVLVKGYYGRDDRWDGTLFDMQKNVAYAQDSVALRVFDRYLDKLKEEDIKVVFVYAPIYIGLIKKMDHIEGMYSMYDSIAKKYDIPILDYNYDPLCCDTAYFYNATHLNKAGAERFSIKLAHAIDSLKLLNK